MSIVRRVTQSQPAQPRARQRRALERPARTEEELAEMEAALRAAAERQRAATLRAAAAPVPTAYRAEWWPAHVRLPDHVQAVPLARVYATTEGLYVFTRRPPQAERATGGTPFWWARLLYDKTPKPVTGYPARDAGIPLVTEVGTVTVTPLGSCGCGHSLKAWRPQWAQRNEAWESGT